LVTTCLPFPTFVRSALFNFGPKPGFNGEQFTLLGDICLSTKNTTSFRIIYTGNKFFLTIEASMIKLFHAITSFQVVVEPRLLSVARGIFVLKPTLIIPRMRST